MTAVNDEWPFQGGARLDGHYLCKGPTMALARCATRRALCASPSARSRFARMVLEGICLVDDTRALQGRRTDVECTDLAAAATPGVQHGACVRG